MVRITCKMRLHTLQSMYEDASPFEVDGPALCEYVSFHLTHGPEYVLHSTPRLLRISTEVAGAVLAHHKANTCLRKLEIDNAALVRC